MDSKTVINSTVMLDGKVVNLASFDHIAQLKWRQKNCIIIVWEIVWKQITIIKNQFPHWIDGSINWRGAHAEDRDGHRPSTVHISTENWK